jgi:hypothetical protein
LWQIAVSSSVATTYGNIVPGMMLIGLGAGLLIPTATNSVVGAVPQGESGVGSATNGVALQVGGALGVAVIGSVLATRYQDHVRAALAGQRIPVAVLHSILGSLGGALGAASEVGGNTGALLANAARSAFMSGVDVSLTVGAIVALCGSALMFARLPSKPGQRPTNADETASGDARPPLPGSITPDQSDAVAQLPRDAVPKDGLTK